MVSNISSDTLSMKNKKLLTLGLSLCTVSAVAALAAVGGGRTIFRHTNALADEVWSHYLAVNPTFDTNGSKEY